MNRSIMLVFAHPDDESFGCAGTVARYVRQGVPVDLITATRGEAGMRLDVPEGVSTGVAREAELRQAAAVMGVRAIYFLDYIDAELDKVVTEEVADRIVKVLRKMKPEVVVTFGPDGITGHADHVAVSNAAARAFEMLGPRTRPRKLYYVTIPASLPGREDWGLTTRPDDEVTTAIDISGYFDVKVKAIAAHRSQQDSRDFIEMLQQQDGGGAAWFKTFASREFFYLARPAKPGVKETDLFE